MDGAWKEGSLDGAGGRLGIYYTQFRASSLLLSLLEGTITDVQHFSAAKFLSLSATIGGPVVVIVYVDYF